MNLSIPKCFLDDRLFPIRIPSCVSLCWNTSDRMWWLCLDLFIFLHLWMDVCVCIYVNTHVPGSTYEGQSSACRSMFSLSTICVVESNFLYQTWWQAALPTEPPCSSLWVLEVSVSRASRTWLKLYGFQETCVHPLTIPGLCLTPVLNK